MPNYEQVNRLRQGFREWNEWRFEHPTENIDLSEALLYDIDLSGVLPRGGLIASGTYFGANLDRANLYHSHLEGADLYHAHLDGANLKLARLSKANLSGANLSGANLSGADLYYTHLDGTFLSEADLSHARIYYTLFGDNDLSVVKGLETVIHDGPSPLSITTIYKSQGDIPEAFVRGCGVPDAFLDYMKALASQPIEYYTCFISYSSQDDAFVKRLYADLQHNNVRCWFAPEDLKIGDEIRPRIDETIRLFDKLLLILSKHSIASKWVAYEVKKALNKEPEGISNVLFPIRIDETILTCHTSWAQDIKATRHIGDFSHWKDHDAYQQAFSRLLRDLKAESKT